MVNIDYRITMMKKWSWKSIMDHMSMINRLENHNLSSMINNDFHIDFHNDLLIFSVNHWID